MADLTDQSEEKQFTQVELKKIKELKHMTGIR